MGAFSEVWMQDFVSNEPVKGARARLLSTGQERPPQHLVGADKVAENWFPNCRCL